MHIALATCAKLPDWEVDDSPLHDAFSRRGITIAHPVWNDGDVDWSLFDACLIRTTWDYQEHCAEFVAWAKKVESVTRLFNSAATVAWNTHKGYLRELGAAGVPLAPTVWLERGGDADLAAILSDQGWQRGFLKPAVGATARETMRFDGDTLAAAGDHLARLLPNEDMLLQPYLGRVETDGELSAIYLDGQLTHAVRKVPVAGDYRVQDDFGATDEPVELDDDARRSAERALAVATEHLGDLLYARVDMLWDDSGHLCLTELELIEPSFFFRHGAHAAEVLAEGFFARVGSAPRRPH